MAQRLPIENSDDGVWGGYLLTWLTREHYDNGGTDADNGRHKTVTIRAGTATAGTAPIKLESGTLMTAAEVGAIEFNSDSLYFTITTGTNRRKVALYDDSSGATGDLYYRNSSGLFTRIPVGTGGYMLHVDNGEPAWGPNASGFATSTKTATTYTITATDCIIFADATSNNVVITLPAAASFGGYRFYVKRIDSTGNTVSVDRSGGNTIDGQTSIAMPQQYMSLTLVSNGSNWYIL